MTQLTKIISGGQTGADQAALDAAIDLGIDHGGWISGGRLTDAGPLPEKYQLAEMPTDGYPERNEQNVRDSDGTVIFSRGPLTGGSKLTAELARAHGKPHLHIDFEPTPPLAASGAVHRWIAAGKVRVLNVSGARTSKTPDIYNQTYRAMWGLLVLDATDFTACTLKDPGRKALAWPETLDELVGFLEACLPFGHRVKISQMNEKELADINTRLGGWIRETFGLGEGNDALLKSAEKWTFRETTSPEDASWVVIRALASRLRRGHWLKMVK
jgi:hypothetical protein